MTDTAESLPIKVRNKVAGDQHRPCGSELRYAFDVLCHLVILLNVLIKYKVTSCCYIARGNVLTYIRCMIFTNILIALNTQRETLYNIHRAYSQYVSPILINMRILLGWWKCEEKVDKNREIWEEDHSEKK